MTTHDRNASVMEPLMTAHRRLALRRRFPDLVVDVRSISDVRFQIGACEVAVIRRPYSSLAVGRPYLVENGWYAPAEASEIHALHAMLLEIVGRHLRD